MEDGPETSGGERAGEVAEGYAPAFGGRWTGGGREKAESVGRGKIPGGSRCVAVTAAEQGEGHRGGVGVRGRGSVVS